jgi:hypothetical protein
MSERPFVTPRADGLEPPSDGVSLPRRSGNGRWKWVVAAVLTPCLGLGVGGALWSSSSATDGLAVSRAAAVPVGQRITSEDTVQPVFTDLSGQGAADQGDADPLSYAAVNSARSSSQVTVRDVNSALARRTAALRKRNEKAFLATFDPAQPKLIATQRVLFRNLVKLPLVSPTYRAYRASGYSSTSVAHVALLHQVRGVDAEPVELSKIEKWVRRKGVVVTTSVSPVAGQSPTRYAPLDQKPLEVKNGPLVTVVGSSKGDLDKVSEKAEKAASAVRALWGRRPAPTRFIVFVSHDRTALHTWFGAIGTPGEAIGVAMPQVGIKHVNKLAGSRVVIDLSSASGDELYRILRHEFVHAIDVRAQTIVRRTVPCPLWVEEGLATWGEEQDLPLKEAARVRELRQLRRYWNGALPPASRSAFYASGERGHYNYDTAFIVFRYIEKRWGKEKVIAFYSAMATGNTKGAWKVLGTNQAAFTKGWKAWADQEVFKK